MLCIKDRTIETEDSNSLESNVVRDCNGFRSTNNFSITNRSDSEISSFWAILAAIMVRSAITFMMGVLLI